MAPRWRTFRLRTQQPDVWAAFLEAGGAMTFPLTSADLPRPPGGSFDAQEVIVAVQKAGTAPSPWGTAITLGSLTPTLAAGAAVGTYATFEAALSAPIGNAVGDLSLSFGTWADDALERAKVEEVWVFVRYGGAP